MAGGRALRYWCGDPFTPTMIKSALNGENWISTINKKFYLSERLVNLYNQKLKKDFEEKLQRTERLNEHFGSSGDFDVFAEKGNNILCVEVKTKIFSTLRRKEYAKYHFDSYPGCLDALLSLPKTSDEKISASCELLKYCLNLCEYHKQSKCHVAVLVPFYINPIELKNIPLYLKGLRQYVIDQHGLDVAMALWCLVAKLDEKFPKDVVIHQIWQSENFDVPPPKIRNIDIEEGDKKFSETRYTYGNCADCKNRYLCNNRFME